MLTVAWPATLMGAPSSVGADVATTTFAIGSPGHVDAPSVSSAFDNNNGTRFASPASGAATAGNSWAGQDFGAGNEQDIIQVGLRNGYTGGSGLGETSVLVQWSNDGTTWNTAYTWSPVDDLAASLQVTPVFPSVGKRRYWRQLSNMTLGGYWTFYEMEFRPAVY